MYRSQPPAWGIKQTTAPAAEPVSVADARAWLRVDGTEQDATIALLIAAARGFTERRTGRALITSGWRLTLDRFPLACAADATPVDWPPLNAIELGRGPVSAVNSVSYVDQAGTTQTLAAGTDYIVDLVREPARVTPAWGKAWPTPRAQIAAVTVDFTAGYADAASVPADLQLAMRLLIAHWFENRETVTVGVVSTALEMAFDELTAPWRLFRFQ